MITRVGFGADRLTETFSWCLGRLLGRSLLTRPGDFRRVRVMNSEGSKVYLKSGQRLTTASIVRLITTGMRLVVASSPDRR